MRSTVLHGSNAVSAPPQPRAGPQPRRLTTSQMARFYAGYAWAKTIPLWREVRSPKVELMLYELCWTIGRLAKRGKPDAPWLFRSDRIVTTRGSFRIRANSMDLLCVSPAFERDDYQHLLKLLERLIEIEQRRVLFIDVGAGVGDYTVTVGNRFKESGRLSIAAFEPLESSLALLHGNISDNGLTAITSVFPVAAFNQDDVRLDFGVDASDAGSSAIIETGGGLRVTGSRIDSCVGSLLAETDVVVMKIDVEGGERQALEGATQMLRAKEAHIMVEDFIDDSIIDYLTSVGAAFQAKHTPYNSWWRL
jgi:FkbM family methyltransferase